MIQLKNILKTLNNREAKRTENVNSKLFKYGSDLLHKILKIHIKYTY